MTLPAKLPNPHLQTPSPTPADAPVTPQAQRAEDFYMQGTYVVFTAAYHLRRGYCCNSDCRHCPYK